MWACWCLLCESNQNKIFTFHCIAPDCNQHSSCHPNPFHLIICMRFVHVQYYLCTKGYRNSATVVLVRPVNQCGRDTSAPTSHAGPRCWKQHIYAGLSSSDVIIVITWWWWALLKITANNHSGLPVVHDSLIKFHPRPKKCRQRLEDRPPYILRQKPEQHRLFACWWTTRGPHDCKAKIESY